MNSNPTSQELPVVELYSKNQCPACNQAAHILESYKIPFVVYKIDEHVSYKNSLIRRYPEARSVPQIFVDGSHLGGLQDLQEWIAAYD